MNKGDIRKEYERSLRRMTLRLTAEEECLLRRMMEDDGWENASGFVKYRLFGDGGRAYRKVLHSGRREDMETVLLTTAESLCRKMAYLGHRYDVTLADAETSADTADRRQMRRLEVMRVIKRAVVSATGATVHALTEMLDALEVRHGGSLLHAAAYVSDEDVAKARADSGDTTSPAAREAARRDAEEARRKAAEEERIRKEAE